MTDRPFQRLSPIRQLILTRLREFYREPSAVFWVYVFPLLMTLTLGLAFRADPKPHYDVTIVESDNSRLVVERLRSDERGRFTIRELPYEKARRLLRTGKTDLVLITAEDGNASAAPPSSDGLAAVRFWFDPRNQNSSLARIAVDSNEAGRMPLSGMDKEGAAIDLDQMEPLLRGKGQILEMLHAARRMEPAGNAAAVALDHPHQRKQQHQECHDDDNLL